MQASNKVGFVATTALRLPAGQVGPVPPQASCPKLVNHRPDQRGSWALPGRSRLVCWRAARRGRRFRRGSGRAGGGGQRVGCSGAGDKGALLRGGGGRGGCCLLRKAKTAGAASQHSKRGIEAKLEGDCTSNGAPPIVCRARIGVLGRLLQSYDHPASRHRDCESYPHMVPILLGHQDRPLRAC